MELVHTISVGRPVLKLRWRPNRRELLCLTTSPEADEISLWEVPESTAPQPLSREAFSFPPRHRQFDLAREAPGRLGDCAFHPSGEWFALARRRQPLEVRRVPDLSVIRQLSGSRAEDSVCFLGGELLAYSSGRRGPGELAPSEPYSRPTLVHNLQTNAVIAQLWESDTALALHPDGRLLAAGWNEQGGSVIWFAEVPSAGTPVLGIRRALTADPGAGGLIFSPSGDLLVAVHLLSRVGFTAFRLPTGQEAFSVSERGTPVIYDNAFLPPPERVVFSPDGSQLVYGGAAGAITELDTSTGKRLRQWEGHRDLVTTLDLEPSSRWLASGGHDGEVRVWRTDYPLSAPRPVAELSGITQAFIDQAGLVDPSHWEPFF